jgi:hypothetical protein
VTGYNASESRLSRLRPERVVGRNFFVEIGPCTNNYLVARRFLDCDELDEQQVARHGQRIMMASAQEIAARCPLVAASHALTGTRACWRSRSGRRTIPSARWGSASAWPGRS